jgi:hypothetical protein
MVKVNVNIKYNKYLMMVKCIVTCKIINMKG